MEQSLGLEVRHPFYFPSTGEEPFISKGRRGREFSCRVERSPLALSFGSAARGEGDRAKGLFYGDQSWVARRRGKTDSGIRSRWIGGMNLPQKDFSG